MMPGTPVKVVLAEGYAYQASVAQLGVWRLTQHRTNPRLWAITHEPSGYSFGERSRFGLTIFEGTLALLALLDAGLSMVGAEYEFRQQPDDDDMPLFEEASRLINDTCHEVVISHGAGIGASA